LTRIRPQHTPDDLAAIEAMVARAFAKHGGTEAFKNFRAERDDVISLVAEQDGRIVGTVLFSPVQLDSPGGPVTGMGLGQLAVEPDYQNQGIGSRLSEAGLQQLRESDCPFVIVIGHAHYYPRFGFEPCERHSIECQWQGIPPETFMVVFPAGRNPQLTGKASFDGL
jgi:putative acetyltransferase